MPLIVTDGEREKCVDHWENEAILDAGGGGGPGSPGGGKNGQMASDSGGSQTFTRCRRAQETGSSQHQATFMHRVHIICLLCVSTHYILTTMM